MRIDEIAQLLTLAAGYDSRWSVRSDGDAMLAAQSFAASAYHNIDRDFGVQALIAHYAAPGALDRPRFSPGDLNEAWRKSRRGQLEAQRLADIKTMAAKAVPPTPEYLAARDALRKVTS